jgi:hypothetical protein
MIMLYCCKVSGVAADIRVSDEERVTCRVARRGRGLIATVYARVCSRPGVLEVQKWKMREVGKLKGLEFGFWSISTQAHRLFARPYRTHIY